MRSNVGRFDKAGRIAIGVGLIGLAGISLGAFAQTSGAKTEKALFILTSDSLQTQGMSMVLANRSNEDVIYPLTVKEIAQAQEDDLVLKKLSKTDKF